MVTNDTDDAPPEYDDDRWLPVRVEMSQSTLASDVASPFVVPFIGSAPSPPPYQPFTMATDSIDAGQQLLFSSVLFT